MSLKMLLNCCSLWSFAARGGTLCNAQEGVSVSECKAFFIGKTFAKLFSEFSQPASSNYYCHPLRLVQNNTWSKNCIVQTRRVCSSICEVKFSQHTQCIHVLI